MLQATFRKSSYFPGYPSGFLKEGVFERGWKILEVLRDSGTLLWEMGWVLDASIPPRLHVTDDGLRRHLRSRCRRASILCVVVGVSSIVLIAIVRSARGVPRAI